MATYTGSHTWHTGDVTAFRAAVRQYTDMLNVCGFPRAADTGQIDPATAALAAANTVSGFEIRRFNDGLQATSPVFMKIEYGTGAAGGSFGVWLQFASGSDGVGNLTGPLSSRIYIGTNGHFTGLFGSFMSGNGSYLAGVLGDSYNHFGTLSALMFCLIERVKNADGTLSPLGVSMIWRPYNGQMGFLNYRTDGARQYAPVYQNVGVMPNVGTNYVSRPFGQSSNANAAGDIAVFPSLAFLPEVRPLDSSVGYVHADIQHGNTFLLSTLGTVKTYRTLGMNNVGSVVMNGGVQTPIATRFE